MIYVFLAETQQILNKSEQICNRNPKQKENGKQ